MDEPEIDYLALHSSGRNYTMQALTNMIGEAGKKIPLLQENLFPHLEEMRTKGDYVGYLALGTQIIEFFLSKLVIVYTHAINYHLREIEKVFPDGYMHDLSIEVKDWDTSGKILQKLNDIFKMNLKHPGTTKLITELIAKRNIVVHDLVDAYDGDLKKLNDALKPFCETKPVESAFERIIDLQSVINTDLIKKRDHLRKV